MAGIVTKGLTGYPGISPKSAAFHGLNPIGDVGFTVDFSQLAGRFGESIGATEAVFANMGPRIASIARYTLIDLFNLAISTAGKAFFADLGYREQIIAAVERMPIEVIPYTGGYEVVVDFDLLGTWDDVAKGFHNEAIIAGSAIANDAFGADSRVHLPYVGQRLKFPYAKRYAFWQSVYTGVPYQPTARKVKRSRRPGESQGEPIDTTGMLEATIAERVRVWNEMGKAPEWLYLQWGQVKSEPVITPFDIVGQFYYEMTSHINSIITDEMDNIWDTRQTVYQSYENPLANLYESVTGNYGVVLNAEIRANVQKAQAAFENGIAQGKKLALTRIGAGGKYVGLRGPSGRFESFNQ